MDYIICTFNTIKRGNLLAPVQLEKAALTYHLSDSDLLFTRLETKEGLLKFWQIAGKLTELFIHYGKMGRVGKKLIKSYASAAEVIIEKRKLIKQKEKKGYKRA
jgi:predicted DNA-binding WGR domain protein